MTANKKELLYLAARLVLFSLLFSWQISKYGYWDLLEAPPQSTHTWRQTDCASMALNYYNNGLDITDLRMHNELYGDGRALGEAPLLYYLVACGYSIFGYNDSIYRGIWIIILFIGLLALMETCYIVSRHLLFSILMPALLFTIPVIVFYGNNFLTDVPGLSLCFVAWFFFVQSKMGQKKILLWLSALFFLLAGLHKAHSLISFIALILTLFFKNSQGFSFNSLFPTLKGYISKYAILLVVLPLFFAWYAFTSYYGKHVGSPYLSAKLFPFWEMTEDQWRLIQENTSLYWLEEYGSTAHLWLMLIGLTLNFIPVPGWRITFWNHLVAWMAVGVFAFVVLFAKSFDYHDYYSINLLGLSAFIFIGWMSRFKHTPYFKLSMHVLTLVLVVFVYSNTLYAKQKINNRYYGHFNQSPHIALNLKTITPHLRSIGIEHHNKVISLPDDSPNISLYYLNQWGFTNHGEILDNEMAIERKIQLGAEYLIIHDSSLLNAAYLQKFMKYKKLEHQGIFVFDLRSFATK